MMEKMSFKDLESKVGFGLTVVIYESKLSADFFKTLTFDQWLEIYGRASFGSELKKTALEKMKEKAQTFDQWLEIYEKASFGSELKKTALEKMKELI